MLRINLFLYFSRLRAPKTSKNQTLTTNVRENHKPKYKNLVNLPFKAIDKIKMDRIKLIYSTST